jgi:O-antigen chain-terminating methyltransferase
LNSIVDEEGVDVAKIMEQVIEKIRKRKESYHVPFSEFDGKMSYDFDRDLSYINSNWEIQNNSYYISSHRKLIGKPIVKGRRLVHGEVRRYVDPVVFKQIEFNGSAVRIFNEIIRRFESLSSRMDQLENTLNEHVNLSEELTNETARVQAELRGELTNETARVQADLRDEISSGIEDRVRAVVAAMNEEIEQRAWLVGILDESAKANYESTSMTNRDNVNYFVFEERFRGSCEDIKGRQHIFIKFFDRCNNVLDIGCGRGEFLELLKEHSIGGRGIDLDEDMVNYCRSRGLDAEKADAITYLEGLEDKSLDGIFIDQVAEHLEPEYLIRMLKLCNDKLMYGHHIIVETVNPLSLFSLANFYIDLSHKKPLHPDTMRFLLQFAGFRDVQTEFLAPVPEDMRLNKINSRGIDVHEEGGWIDIYNRNIDMLNDVIFGAQDYFIVGKR